MMESHSSSLRITTVYHDYGSKELQKKSLHWCVRAGLELIQPYNQFDLTPDTDLGHDALDLRAHGTNAYATLRCHEFGRPAFGQLLNYFRFSGCERVGGLQNRRSPSD